MSSHGNLEQSLLAGMKRLTVPYQEALSVLESQQDDIASMSTLMERLRPSMELIATLESEVQQLRTRWNEGTNQAGRELSDLSTLHGDLLKRLIERLNGVEQAVSTKRKRVASELDSSARENEMRRAYRPVAERQF